MTKSARIQEGVVEFLADGCPHTVQEIKSFLQQVGISDYSEGQFSGSINTLLRNQSIKKIDSSIADLYPESSMTFSANLFSSSVK